MPTSESADSSRFFARFAASAAAIVGLFVVAGWLMNLEPPLNIVSGWQRMARLTAISFVLAGIAPVADCRAPETPGSGGGRRGDGHRVHDSCWAMSLAGMSASRS